MHRWWCEHFHVAVSVLGRKVFAANAGGWGARSSLPIKSIVYTQINTVRWAAHCRAGGLFHSSLVSICAGFGINSLYILYISLRYFDYIANFLARRWWWSAPFGASHRRRGRGRDNPPVVFPPFSQKFRLALFGTAIWWRHDASYKHTHTHRETQVPV